MMMSLHNTVKMIEKGQMVICPKPQVIYRLEDVGACVGVFLYHPQKKMGGVMYGMLPSAKTTKVHSLLSDYAFIDKGLPRFIETVSSILDCCKKGLKAVVVGGANMQTQNAFLRLGDQNVDIVRSILEKEKIDVQGEAVGGSYNRRVQFVMKLGCVQVQEFNTIYDISFL